MPRRRLQLDASTARETEKHSVPSGAPSWVTRELIEKTISVWQPYYADRLTDDEALAMILNVARLFDSFSEGGQS